MSQNKQMTINYQMINLLQFSFSILVIALHCTRIFNNDILHFIQKSFFSRMAVPYFIMSSSYFIALKTYNNPNYLKQHQLKTIKKYLFWSFLFLPYSYFYFQKTNFDSSYLLIGFIFALTYVGTCYHLWYIPALLFATNLTNWFVKLYGWLITFLICFTLYILGSVETYSLFLTGTSAFPIYTFYKQFLFTTRNGLFFSPIFVLLGFLFHYYFYIIQKTNPKHLLFVSSLLFTLEAFLIFFNQGDDKNFYLSLLPFTFSLFYWSTTTNFLKEKDFLILKKMSVLFFFLHPLFIEVFPLICHQLSPDSNFFGVAKLIFTVSSCLFSYMIIQKTKQFIIFLKSVE